jgi:hypothetical protein
MLITSSDARESRSLICLNSFVNPVRAAISSKISGSSARGSRRCTSLRNAIRLSGSSSLSRPLRIRSSLPSTCSIRAALLFGKFAATALYVWSSSWRKADSASSADAGRPRLRHMNVLAPSQASPSSKPIRGSAYRTLGMTNTSHRRRPLRRRSKKQNVYAWGSTLPSHIT